MPPFKLAPVFRERIAVQDSYGKISYENLFRSAKVLSDRIVEELRKLNYLKFLFNFLDISLQRLILWIDGKQQNTISYLCSGDSTHIITQWAIWMSGNIGEKWFLFLFFYRVCLLWSTIIFQPFRSACNILHHCLNISSLTADHLWLYAIKNIKAEFLNR